MIQTYFTVIRSLCRDIIDDLIKVSYWFKLNKLSLNRKKTNIIVFQTRNNKLPNGNLSIKIDDTVIEQVNNTNFLGVIINNNLNMG